MNRSAGTSTETMRDCGLAAACWSGYVFFGYLPPALLAGQEAVSR